MALLGIVICFSHMALPVQRQPRDGTRETSNAPADAEAEECCTRPDEGHTTDKDDGTLRENKALG
jgi:hypothetical protein